MKFLILMLLFGFASPLVAGGSWGGGTPPAKQNQAADLPCLGSKLSFRVI